MRSRSIICAFVIWSTVAIAQPYTISTSVAEAELYTPAVLTPSPALYCLQEGAQGAMWNGVTGEIASNRNPATAGDVLSMHTTSLIEEAPFLPSGRLGRLAEILFFGDAPGYPGYFQVNFRVPTGVTPGPAIPVRLAFLNRPSNEVSVGVK